MYVLNVFDEFFKQDFSLGVLREIEAFRVREACEGLKGLCFMYTVDWAGPEDDFVGWYPLLFLGIRY